MQLVQQMLMLIHNLFYPFPEKLNLERRDNDQVGTKFSHMLVTPLSVLNGH